MQYLANNPPLFRQQRFRANRAISLSVLAIGLLINVCGCQFPYKIDPSGNCLFVKNEDYTLPEQQSPFVSQPGNRPLENATSSPTTDGMTATIPATTDPAYQSTLPGVSAIPGTASGVAPSATSGATGVIRGASPGSGSTLLVPGSGPIVLVMPEEQIALIGTEIILFANYKGDDDYLRIGERIEWSLGGVGHIQTTNKTQCSNALALDFNRDKKISDRFAVTSTLHYEGTIDRGSADEQGQVPHLAGQSWVSIRSAEEGTSTVTAYAPTIKDWNRRTSSAVVHWIDAEWVYPSADVTKYDEPKVFVTQVKKRSSGAPCPGWVVRYEITGGPNAGLGPNRSKTVEVTTNSSGDAAIDLTLLEGSSGTSMVKATIIRPSGVDGGTKQLELHSSTLTNIWSTEAPLRMQTIVPASRWGENVAGVINVSNSSTVSKSGIVSLPLPNYLKLVSSEPRPTSQVAQDNGGQLITWHVQDFKGQRTTQIKFVLQSVTDNAALMSQSLNVDLNAQLSMFPTRDTQVGDSSNGSGLSDTTGGSNAGQGFGDNFGTFPITPAPDNSGTQTQPPFGANNRPDDTGGRPRPGGGTRPGGTNSQGSNNPTTFSNQLQVRCQAGAMMTVNQVNYVYIEITNNATTPFYQGMVQVQVPNGMGFTDQNGKWYTDDRGNIATIVNYPITGNDGKDVAIPSGGIHKLPIAVMPQQAGQYTINVFVGSPQQNSSDLTPIIGATTTSNRITVN